MAHTIGTGPEPGPVPTSPAVRVQEITLAAEQWVAALDAQDHGRSILASIAEELEAARAAYEYASYEADVLVALGLGPDVDELDAAAAAYVAAAARAADSRATLKLAKLRATVETLPQAMDGLRDSERNDAKIDAN
jgi:hypothetical protein